MKKIQVVLWSTLLLWVGLAACKGPKTASKDTKSSTTPAVVATATDAKADGPAAKVVSVKDAVAIPFDPNVRMGKLDNGLTYYIRKNSKPENAAELRLVVNAGSILETDAQQGVAHFLEHMCFNGTKNFPKSDLVDYLESIGTRFGAHLNAYTNFDETVYMLRIPTDKEDQFNKGFQVLEDWAHQVSFDGEEN